MQKLTPRWPPDARGIRRLPRALKGPENTFGSRSHVESCQRSNKDQALLGGVGGGGDGGRGKVVVP